jgi:hypothetical protein
MPRPICFMIMPYGTKPTNIEGGKGPDKIHCDALWERALQPLIEEDLGYHTVRADQDLGALIIQEMIERLASADLVIADITIPNGNVYYEVGIRHAAKEKGCVLIAADWSQPLFGINQMRRVQYPLPEGAITDATAQAVRAALQNGVQKLVQGASAVWLALPSFPRVDAEKARRFQQQLQELSAFQAEVRAARQAPEAERRTRAFALRDSYRAAAARLPALALEILYFLRDCADWQTTLEYIDGLPEDIRSLAVVQEQRCLARSKAGDHLEAVGALLELIRSSGDTSERRGLLGGRYKKLYESAVDAVDKTHYLDLAIEQYERGMKLDLNDYYPAANLPRLLRLRREEGDEERAQAAAAVTLLACERALKRNPSDSWIKPTLLGAAFDAGDVLQAKRLYQEIRREGAVAWQLKTTVEDLETSVHLLQEEDHAVELEQVLMDLKRLLGPHAV